MSAIVKNIVCENRVRLEEVIPVDTPFSICIDPSNVCNFKCNFCAIQKSSHETEFKKQLMSYDSFIKIIEDLRLFDKRLKLLRLSGQGEPMLNPRYTDMVMYAKKAHIADYIETITNGSRLNPELNQRIVDSGIDRIRISIEAVNNEGYLKTANVNLDFDGFVSNVKDLYIKSRGKCSIYIKTVDASLKNEDERNKFYDIFEDICDQIFVDKVIPLWSDFDEINDYYSIKTDKGIHGQKIKRIQICPFPFYSCIINPDGDVTVCCADWKRKLVVGNAIEESIVDIWRGEKIKSFWVDLASKNKNNYEMCRKCVLPTFDCNDDIDEYGELILRNLNR